MLSHLVETFCTADYGAVRYYLRTTPNTFLIARCGTLFLPPFASRLFRTFVTEAASEYTFEADSIGCENRTRPHSVSRYGQLLMAFHHFTRAAN